MVSPVSRWLTPVARTIAPLQDAQHTDLAVQIGFAARFDLDDLEAETLRFFVDDEATLGDPFDEDAHLRTVHTRVLQDLGFFLRDQAVDFSQRVGGQVFLDIAHQGGVFAQLVPLLAQGLIAWSAGSVDG